MDARITCERCKSLMAAAPTNEHGQHQPNMTHEVGALAEISMGHALMFARDGRTALCIADRKPA